MPETADRADRVDLQTYLGTAWRWKYLFLAFIVVIPLVSYALATPGSKYYESSTLLQAQNFSVDTSLFPGGQSYNTTSDITATARLITTRRIATQAAQLLHPPAGPWIVGQVSASADTNGGFITITAQDSNPKRAAAIANAFAAAIVGQRKNQAIGDLNYAIGGVQAQLDSLPPGNQLARGQLSDQLQRLRAVRAAQTGNAQVIDPAIPSSAALGSDPRKHAVELGLVIALLLGIGAIFLAENADRKIRSPQGLEELTDLPLLAAIPPTAFSASLDASGYEEESFQMLRAALTYFNVDRRLASVVIASPGQREGKTTVATRLALASARSGKRVILVDADLRRPQVARRLGIEPAAGLGNVLAGEERLGDVLVDYPVEESRGGGSLTVLQAGPTPPNPTELLSSHNMQLLLSTLETQADLVIVDTAAALAVSDPLPLLQQATGVVVVARMSQSRKDPMRRLLRIIDDANGTVLGAVATGSGNVIGYEGYHYAYYAADDNGAGGNGGWRPGRRRQPSATERLNSRQDLAGLSTSRDT